MATRTQLNEVLTFIDAETLTDEEWDALDVDDISVEDREAYDALRSTLGTREAVSDTYRRLASYYKAQGMTFTETDATGEEADPLAKSNIFVGSEL